MSIADNEYQHIKHSREEQLTKLCYEESVTFRRLRKLADAFPYWTLARPDSGQFAVNVQQTAADHLNTGTKLDDLVSNPLYGRHGEFLFHGGGLPRDGSFDQVLDRAISGKEAKRSDGKENTVL